MTPRPRRSAATASKKKPSGRIGHVYHGKRAAEAAAEGETVPRGWIHPDGRFFDTQHHWNTIAEHLGEGETDGAEAGERHAHKAYALGWISLGHGGVLNAVGHKNTFDSASHPAVATLRKLVSKSPHFVLRVERQIGKLDRKSGRHEDFDIREYDLDVFIRRGALRKST